MRLLWRSLLALALALASAALAAVRAAAQQEPTAVEQELEEFVPSEHIPADSAVSFPSDI